MQRKWVRLQADLNCNLRRGAWYRLLSVERLAVVVDVNHQPVPIVRAFVQITESAPRRWTVVPTPSCTARPLPLDLGTHYAVCPSCRDRVALHGRPPRLLCRRCGVDFAVAWDEHYLAELL
jgi:hypothetical protein